MGDNKEEVHQSDVQTLAVGVRKERVEDGEDATGGHNAGPMWSYDAWSGWSYDFATGTYFDPRSGCYFSRTNGGWWNPWQGPNGQPPGGVPQGLGQAPSGTGPLGGPWMASPPGAPRPAMPPPPMQMSPPGLKPQGFSGPGSRKRDPGDQGLGAGEAPPPAKASRRGGKGAGGGESHRGGEHDGRGFKGGAPSSGQVQTSPLGEMRALVRLTNAVFTRDRSVARDLNRYTEEDVKRYLSGLGLQVGVAPLLHWGCPRGKYQALADMFSWILSAIHSHRGYEIVVSEEQAQECVPYKAGSPYVAADTVLHKLGLSQDRWTLPLRWSQLAMKGAWDPGHIPGDAGGKKVVTSVLLDDRPPESRLDYLRCAEGCLQMASESEGRADVSPCARAVQELIMRELDAAPHSLGVAAAPGAPSASPIGSRAVAHGGPIMEGPSGVAAAAPS